MSPDEKRSAARAASEKWYAKNKVLAKERAMKWKRDNPEKVAASSRKRLYGITSEQWEDLFARQGKQCATCDTKTPVRGMWHTDHCHTTGRVRGILCERCNLALGYVSDDVSVLRKMIDYLGGGYQNDT